VRFKCGKEAMFKRVLLAATIVAGSAGPPTAADPVNGM
jgi:hypothetical protein